MLTGTRCVRPANRWPRALYAPSVSRLALCRRVPRAALAQRPNAPRAPEPAPAQGALRQVIDALTTGGVLEAKVLCANKGGYLVEVGDLRGFVPNSQLNASRIKLGQSGFKDPAGQSIKLKVLSADQQGGQVQIIFSERRVEETNRLQELQVGTTINGTVVNITDFGAFVRLDAQPGSTQELTGLVIKDEVSWEQLLTVEAALSVGQKVTAKVIEVVPERNRLSLSIKQTLVDPLRQTKEQLEWTDGCADVPEITALLSQLRRQQGVQSVTPTRQAQAKQVAAQELELYLSRSGTTTTEAGSAPSVEDAALSGASNGEFTVTARLGVRYQEMLLQASLSRSEVKEALQRAVAATARHP